MGCKKSSDAQSKAEILWLVGGRVLILGITSILIAGFILALELWWVALTLCAANFALAIEVHGRFSGLVREIRQRRLDDTRAKMKRIIAKAAKAKGEDIEKYEEEIFGMEGYYVSAERPKQILQDCVQFFVISGFVFLGVVLVRAGIDYGMVKAQDFAWLEGFGFIMGVLMFVGAVVNAIRLMRLDNLEKSD